MKEFRSLGTRQTPIAEDAAEPKLLTLAVQLSPHAYRLVREQYKFACSAAAQYSMKIYETRVELRMPSDDDEHAVHVVNTNVRVFCMKQWIRYHFGYLTFPCACFSPSSAMASSCRHCCCRADM
jgi:hypothetical protein